MATLSERAYLAGVIDSDGYIGIKRSTYAMRVTKDAKAAVYSERICVKQVEPHAVRLLHSLFGGTLGITKPSAAKGRHLHYWQCTDMRAAVCLKSLLPFLRIKRAQAENALNLRTLKIASKSAKVAKGRGHIGAAHRPQSITDQMEAAYLTAKALNHVGV